METVFIDTHILIWLYEANIHFLSQKAHDLIEQCVPLASPISLLEMDYLHECKKLIPTGPAVCLALKNEVGLEIPDDSFAEVMKTARDLSWTRDPFDRILVAHAMLKQLPLVTKDHLLRRHYRRCVW